MADCKVFYSWQSDLPNSTNRGFIGEALQKATKLIRNDESIEVDPVVDRDTANVPGRVIMVMNTAFGQPENLPFDLKMRRVITYISNKEDSDRSNERSKLESTLKSALSSILEKGLANNNFDSQLQNIINEFSYDWELVKSTEDIEKAKKCLNQSINRSI